MWGGSGGRGGLTSLTSRWRTTPPLGPEAEPPPPPKAPRTATPVPQAERAEPAAGRGQRGAVHEWVEQQQLLQRAGASEARAISAEAANRDLEARLSRANEDRQAVKSRLADVTKELDRLLARVKTLERDLGTARKAAGAPAKPPAQVGQGAEGAEAPPGERVGGAANVAGVRYLLAGAQAWHAQAEACAGQMSAVSCGLRMALMASGQQADVDSVAPDAPRVSATLEDVRRQYPPPTASRQWPWTPPSLRRWWSRAPRALLVGALLRGGGGGGSSPFHFGTACPF